MLYPCSFWVRVTKTMKLYLKMQMKISSRQVVMTVDGKSYTADITDNTVTITVPYTVSLNNAEVEFKYTTSATIIPDPETVTDWDNERTFQVTSYNGDAREYAYKVEKQNRI